MASMNFRTAHWPYIGGGVALLLIAGLGVVRAYRERPSGPTPHKANSSARLARDEELLLSSAERQLLWDVEDVAFQLGRKVLATWDTATGESNREPLERAFAADFRGRVPIPSPRDTAQFDGWTRSRVDLQAASARTVSARELIDEILAQRAAFAELETVHWAVSSLRPNDRPRLREGGCTAVLQLELRGLTENGGRAETLLRSKVATTALPAQLDNLSRWIRQAEVISVTSVRQTADSTASDVGAANRAAPDSAPWMLDVTDGCGVRPELFHDNWPTGVFEQVTGGVYVSDYNRDGWLDFLVTDVRRHALFRGLGAGRFAEVTAEAGLPTSLGPKPVFALFADFDNDGYDDLVLGRSIYRNRGDGRFDEITELARISIPEDANNLSVADYDNDGRLDLYICIARPARGTPETRRGWLDVQDVQPNRLWRNCGGFEFVDVTEAAGVGNRGRSFAAVWLHCNEDRYPDLFVANEIGQNALYVNSPTGRFRQVDIDGARFGGFSMGVDAGDLDEDGWPDLYVSNMYSKAGNRVIENLRPESYPAGVFDKVRDFCTGNRLYLGSGNGAFREVGRDARVANVGWAYGARIVDLDGDGRLDLFGACGHQSVSREDPDG